MPHERISDDEDWDLKRICLDAAAGQGYERTASDAVATVPVRLLRLLLSAADRDAAAEEALRDYYYALDNRQHGGVAADRLTKDLGRALGMSWEPGAERERRQGRAA